MWGDPDWWTPARTKLKSSTYHPPKTSGCCWIGSLLIISGKNKWTWIQVILNILVDLSTNMWFWNSLNKTYLRMSLLERDMGGSVSWWRTSEWDSETFHCILGYTVPVWFRLTDSGHAFSAFKLASESSLDFVPICALNTRVSYKLTSGCCRCFSQVWEDLWAHLSLEVCTFFACKLCLASLPNGIPSALSLVLRDQPSLNSMKCSDRGMRFIRSMHVNIEVNVVQLRTPFRNLPGAMIWDLGEAGDYSFRKN